MLVAFASLTEMQIAQYWPVVVQALVAIAVALGALGTSVILGKIGSRNPAKDIPYECGKNPASRSVPRFTVKFYVIAMIFILFDIEVIFMYPWAVSFMPMLENGMAWSMILAMFVFVLIVEIGHLYAYRKGVFDWNRRH